MITPNIIERSWIQGATVAVEYLTGTAFSGENGAHTFRITGKDAEGQPVAVSGTVLAKILRADNITVDVSGSVVDGVAEVTLVGDCYNVPGRTSLVIFLSDGTNTVTLYAAIFNVFRSTSGEEIDSGVSIPTLTELLAQIERMEAATEAAEEAAEAAEEAATVVTRIPSAYRQVEYLDNAGTAYIDIQEPLTGDSRVFMVYAMNAIGTGTSAKTIFGWYRNGYMSYALATQQGNWMYRYGNQDNLVLLKNNADLNIHVLDFNKGKISLDGTLCADNDELEFTANTQFRLFGTQSGAAAQRIIGDVRVYRFDWYKGNALVHSYIPVERVADGVLGLWDLVEEEFITATSGTFSKGYSINLMNNALAIDELKAAVANGVTAAQLDAIDAQVTYTAVMTDTLL